ncbi:MAG: glycosyl hydrolase family 28-related protein, partial [bacterium]|nr:glycosyl hydrolase family 28-related protein [bacterium]
LMLGNTTILHAFTNDTLLEKDKNTLLLMHFSEGSGALAKDSSSYARDGAISGAAWTASGKFGNALSFDGTDDYVSLSSPPDWSAYSSGTIEMWIKPSITLEQGVGDRVFFMYYNSNTNYLSFRYLGSNGSLICEVRSTSAGNQSIQYTKTFDAGQWYHIAVVQLGGKWMLYIDGEVAASAEGSRWFDDIPAAVKVEIGDQYYSGNHSAYFPGVTDELRISEDTTMTPWVDIRTFGAVGDGSADDTTAIQNAVDIGANMNKPVYFPTGTYRITSAIVVAANKPVNWVGAGIGITKITQQTTDADAFQIGGTSTDTNYSHISGMSVSTVSGTGNAFKLTRVHRGTFAEIDINGVGDYGFYLKGALLNTFNKVSSRASGTGLFHCERETVSSICCNANTFNGCIAEGVGYGWHFADQAGQGNNTIIGGVAESISSYSIWAENCRGLNVYGTHFESDANGIYLKDCAGGELAPSDSRTITLENCSHYRISGYGGSITLDQNTRFSTVENFTYTSGGGVTSFSETNYIRDAMQVDTTRGCTGAHAKDFNIVKNGGLESWAGGFPKPFKNFNSAGIILTGDGQADTTKKTGKYAVKVTKTSAYSYQGLSYSIPDVFKGQWITISCWVNAASGQGMILWYVYGGAPNALYLTSVIGVWQKYTGSFYFDPDSNSMTLVFGGLYDSSDDCVYFDDIQIWAEHNPYPLVAELADADTSPSVGLYGSNDFYRTNNTAATTITTFDDGYTGQKITILFNDANTIIVESGNIKLSSSFASTADDTMELIYDGTNWYEVSRSVN